MGLIKRQRCGGPGRSLGPFVLEGDALVRRTGGEQPRTLMHRDGGLATVARGDELSPPSCRSPSKRCAGILTPAPYCRRTKGISLSAVASSLETPMVQMSRLVVPPMLLIAGCDCTEAHSFGVIYNLPRKGVTVPAKGSSSRSRRLRMSLQIL
jgi:hypothetical protein